MEPSFELRELEMVTATRPPEHDDFLEYDGDSIIWRAAAAWAPRRPELAVRLAGRRWVQLLFNSRGVEESTWTYQSVTLNLGRFPGGLDPNVFRCTTPDHVQDLRAQLR